MGDRMNRSVFICYHTPGAYADEARLVRESFTDFGCESYIEEIEPVLNWDAATHFKAQFVRRCMDRFAGRTVIYLDVDSLILAPVDELYQLDCDLAAVRFERELLGGLIVVNPTAAAKATIDAWCDLCQTVSGEWDQRKLNKAIRQTGAKLKELGQEWMWMPGLTPRVYGHGIAPKIITTRGSLRHNPEHK